jgi:protocatechuate 3,4-dioxygenase beta subunit
MDHDDVQVGRILSRREALALLGAGGVGGAAALTAPGAAAGATGTTRPPFRLPKCIVRPSQTEGPYFVDTELDRSDIRSDPADGSVCEGAPLALEFQVSRISPQRCEPLPGALVDVWQCDAAGVYSGVKDIAGLFDTTGKRFLRGHQVTDRQGVARFTTIYPGWYPGRTVHIHFKIRTNPGESAGHEFTSQVYFDDAFTDRVFEAQPYAAKTGPRARNADDVIYRSGGSQLLLDVTEDDAGYRAVFDVGLQLD